MKKLWTEKEKKNITRKIFGTIYSVIWRCVILCAVIMTYIVVQRYAPAIKEDQMWAKKIIADSKAEDFQPKETGTTIYDAKGNIIAKYTDGSRLDYLYSEDIPENIKNAFVAIEDRTFYTNKGFDIKGIARVLINYARSHGDEAHGASTITQQLVRMAYLTQEKSIGRKIKELFLSYYMTEKYSKDEILEFYINKCCFANNIYGIEAASKAYFGKDVSGLSIGEAAYLCAIPNRPEYYDPWKAPANALTRRDKIIRDMCTEGYISEEEKDIALSEQTAAEVLPEQTGANAEENAKERYVRLYMKSYATAEICKWQMEQDGFEFKNDFETDSEQDAYQSAYNDAYSAAYKELTEKKYNVYTSLDFDTTLILQNALDLALKGQKETTDDGIYDVQGAMAVVDNSTGMVTGVVGGRSQDNVSNQLNRACQSYRQPGSSIKPLVVYTPGLMRGYEPESMLTDVSVTAANETGEITDGEQMTLREAVERSKNGCAYYLFNDITPSIGLSFIKEMDFSRIAPSDTALPAALGGLRYGTNAVEMAGAYHTLYDEGTFTHPTCLILIQDGSGAELYHPADKKEVYYKRESAQMIDIMKDVISYGTAAKMGWDQNNIEAAGKTGTTNDYKDGWFCGMTPYYTLTCWVGADTPRPIKGLYGATYPMNAWKKAMTELIKGKAPARFDLSHEADPDTVYQTKEEIKKKELEKDMAAAEKMVKAVDSGAEDYIKEVIKEKYEPQDEAILSKIDDILSWVDICVTTDDAMKHIDRAKETALDLKLDSEKKKAEKRIKKAEKKAEGIDARMENGDTEDWENTEEIDKSEENAKKAGQSIVDIGSDSHSDEDAQAVTNGNITTEENDHSDANSKNPDGTDKTEESENTETGKDGTSLDYSSITEETGGAMDTSW